MSDYDPFDLKFKGKERPIEASLDPKAPAYSWDSFPPGRYGMSQKQFVDDYFSRRYSNYYSWIIPEVDKKGGLLTLGRMVIIGGQHGSGKSTYLTEVAKHNALSKKTLLIPLEMGADFTLMMLTANLFNHTRPPEMHMLGYGELEEGYFYQRPKEDQALFRQCADDIYKKYPKLYIRTPKTLTLEDLLQFIEYHNLEEDIKFFVIDHLHQLDTSSADNETAFYSMVAKELKEIAQRLDIALLCVVQLTKAANATSVDLDLSSFKGTSEFTSNAHRVVLIKRPHYNPPKEREVRSLLKDEKISTSGGTIDEFVRDDRLNFLAVTRHIRELAFLKTRGRDGGVITIRMSRGEFKFLNYDNYVYKADANENEKPLV